MKKLRFSEIQIVGILKEADAGMPVEESTANMPSAKRRTSKWKFRYGGMEASNLKRMYADLTLENTAMQDLIRKKL